MRRVLFVLLLAAPSLFAAEPAEVAFLVLEEDRAAVQTGVAAALLAAPDALTRATAARVATVRDLADLAPRILDLLRTEQDPIAAREQIRAVAILSTELRSTR